MSELPYRVISDVFYAAPAPQRPPEGFCEVYWGSHGCHEPRGHPADVPHACDCCECVSHPDPDPDNPNSEPSCVAKPPYYGPSTLFYGEDAELYGLPGGDSRPRPAHIRRETCRYCSQQVILGKRGWRRDSNHPSGYDCDDAPRGRHGITRKRG